MRTNSHAIGTRVIVEGQGIHVTYDHTTPDSGLGQSIGPVVLGLGNASKPPTWSTCAGPTASCSAS